MIGRSNKVLFIEGTADDTNGALRIGFGNLLKQELDGKMPRIIMGNGVSETINHFKNKQSPQKATLIDLDGKGTNITQGNYDQAKTSKRKLHNLSSSDLVYFMVQKMEAWFLSQPDVLKKYFGKEFNKIPFDHPSKIELPDDILMDLTKELKFKSYHKVRDGSRLLEKLDLSKLKSSFPDVKELVEKLNS
jgi:hypothetical protein